MSFIRNGVDAKTTDSSKTTLDTFQLASEALEETAHEYLLTENNLYKTAFIRWLQTRNVINMHRVCQSFYDDRLHYPKSLAESFDSSLPCFERIYEKKQEDIIPKIASYRIKDGFDAAKALKTLLMSYTMAECAGSINISFYLTIYDVIKLIHQDNADNVFNQLFGSHRPLQERFSFGPFNNCLADDKNFMVCPHQFFTGRIANISLETLIHSPAPYIGMKFYVKGHENYLDKHPEGAACGWNVMFYGLNNKKQPLFLAAMEAGKSFCVTYQDLIQLLKKEYNALPSFVSKTYIKHELNNDKKIIGFLKGAVWFDIKKLVMLKNVEEVSASLNTFISIKQLEKLPQIEPRFIINDKKLGADPKTIIAKKIKPFQSLDTEVPSKYLLTNQTLSKETEKKKYTSNPYLLHTSRKRKRSNSLNNESIKSLESTIAKQKDY